jgi:O-antigen ligase
MMISSERMKVAAKLYTVGVLTFSTGAFGTLLVNTADPAQLAAGSPIVKAVWGFVYAVTIISLVAKRREAIVLIRNNKALFALVGLTLASVLWSLDPMSTLHQGALTLLTLLFAMDLSIRYNLPQQITIIARILIVLVLLSVVAEVLLPGFIPNGVATAHDEVPWHGVFAFKNEFARYVCIGVAACLAMPHRSNRFATAAVAIGAILAVVSKSVSSVGYLAATVALFLGLPILKWAPRRRLMMLGSLAILATATTVFVSVNLAELTYLVGKDPTLTGRTDLWNYSLQDIYAKPLLGYGYQAFWAKQSQPAWRIREAIHWEQAPHSHNGYIETALATGLVGLICFFLALGVLFKRAYVLFMTGSEYYRRWPLMYLFLATIYGMTEAGTVGGNSVAWILFCSLAFSLTVEAHATSAVRARTFSQPLVDERLESVCS